MTATSSALWRVRHGGRGCLAGKEDDVVDSRFSAKLFSDVSTYCGTMVEQQLK